MKKQSLIYLMSALILSILISSCTSGTRINSQPEGALVKINGQTVGTTPYYYEDSKISFSRTYVTLEKEGYEDFYVVLRKDEEVDVGAVVGGIIFGGWPFIWTFGYMPDHYYVLTPQESITYDLEIDQKKKQRISELNELYKKGALNRDEYEHLKQKIIKGVE